MEDQAFFEVLDIAVKETSTKVVKGFSQLGVVIYSVEFDVPLSDDVKASFGLTSDIKFFVKREGSNNSRADMSYLYKDAVVKPDGYYVLPNPCVDVSTLRILQECIKQNTHKPDIKPIQDGTIK